MRQERLLELIGQVDGQYVREADGVHKMAAWKRWCAIAACALLCICGTLAGHHAYQTYNEEVSYVCLDVNPSFELCLNHKNVVVHAIAYNEDGEELLSKVEYKNKHYEDVIRSIFHHDDFQKYLTQDLTITVVSDDGKIQQSIQEYMEQAQCNGKVICSSLQVREEAYSNHCSVGKYVAYEELSQYDQDVTLEDCKGMSMHQIYEEIEKHHSAHHSNQENVQEETTGATQSGHHSDHHSDHHSCDMGSPQ